MGATKAWFIELMSQNIQDNDPLDDYYEDYYNRKISKLKEVLPNYDEVFKGEKQRLEEEREGATYTITDSMVNFELFQKYHIE